MAFATSIYCRVKDLATSCVRSNTFKSMPALRGAGANHSKTLLAGRDYRVSACELDFLDLALSHCG